MRIHDKLISGINKRAVFVNLLWASFYVERGLEYARWYD